ncbi:MAG: PAS domain-containing protein [Chromatiales bacterium]|nr:PAS domain-containing protein [Chromatiales bacterium]
MDPADVPDASRELVLQLYGIGARRVWVSDREVPYPDGRLIVSTTDTAGIITHCNASFVEMSGYDRDTLVGSPHSILRHPDMPAAAFQQLWDEVSAGRIWHGYVKNLRRDGAFYWVYATVIPNVRDGAIKSYTSVRRKPSRRRVEEAETAYRQALAQEASA